MMAWHEVLTHVKRRQPLNKDVFEASVLRFFIVSFKRFPRWVPFGVFLHYLLKFKRFVAFFISLPKCDCESLCLWLECVCVHPLNKGVSQAIIGTFYQCHFQKMAGWDKVAFMFSPLFMLKIKSFKMWLLVSLFMLLRFLPCMWKVIPYRKRMSWGMCSL